MSAAVSILVRRLSHTPFGFRPKAYIQRVLALLGINSGSFEFTFVDNERILQINQDYLQHDYATDIITFNLGTRDAIMADVYISIEQAQIQAQDLGHSLVDELKTLIIHGILHLLDYQDDSELERERMFAKQSEVFELAR